MRRNDVLTRKQIEDPIRHPVCSANLVPGIRHSSFPSSGSSQYHDVFDIVDPLSTQAFPKSHTEGYECLEKSEELFRIIGGWNFTKASLRFRFEANS